MLNTFSHDFLIQIAREKGLSHDQQAIFLPRFSGNKEYKDIAREVGISRDACLKRMGSVYQKFDIPGKTRGKEAILRQQLNDLRPLDISLEEFESLCATAKRIQNEPSRYVTKEPFSQQALIQLLIDKFITLLPSAIKTQNLESRLDLVVDIITKTEFCLSNVDNSVPKRTSVH